MIDVEWLKKYLKQFGPANPLSAQDEKRLFKKWKNENNDEAFQILVKRSQYIVIEEVIYFVNSGIEIEDLIQEANLALLNALSSWNTRLRGGLKNYLHRNVYRNLQNSIADISRLIRYPHNVLDDLSSYQKELNKFYNSFNRFPYWDELLSICSLNYEKCFFYYDVLMGKIYPYCLIEFDENEFIVHNKDINNVLLEKSLKYDLSKVLKSLNENEQKVLKLYFGIDNETDMTLNDIGLYMSLTRERIRQIKENAIQKLQNKSRRKKMIGYFVNDCTPEYIGNRNEIINNTKDPRLTELLEILKDYVKPCRRMTAYPDIPNIANKCRKIVVQFIKDKGRPTTYEQLKRHLTAKLPLINPEYINYALSTSEDIISSHKGVYVLKEWFGNTRSKIEKKKDKNKADRIRTPIDSQILSELYFSNDQKDLLRYFKDNDGKLSKFKITIYSRSRQIDFRPMLLTINQKFEKKYRETLIKEDNSAYIINENFVIM